MAILLSFAAYYHAQASMNFPKAESLLVEEVKIHGRLPYLIGVYVRNLNGKPIGLSEVDVIKVQAKKMILSIRHSPPLILEPKELRFLSMTCPLDPEGADYKVLVVTDQGTASTLIFGYPKG